MHRLSRSNKCAMQSEALRGEVQKKDAQGVWRTILTASGHTVHDGWKVPHDWRHNFFVDVTYVPGPAGAYSPFRSGMQA